MPQYIGVLAPTGKIFVYPDAEISQSNTFTWVNSIPYRVHAAGATELELPRVKSITINRDADSDAATCTVVCYDPSGALNPINSGTWERVLVPNTMIKTRQGYGVAGLATTGMWLIDRVSFSNPPSTVTIQCRDLAKLLLVQTLYPPIVPDDFYPVGFCTTNDKQTNEIYKKAKRWIPYSDLTEIVKFFLRLAGFDSWTVETTGVMVPLEEMSQMMLIDAINRIKDIVGYRFYVDRYGIPHFIHAPIAGSVIPASQYLIHQTVDIVSINRTISDDLARSKIISYGKTVGGIGNINVIPPRDVKNITYENRQITGKYCFSYYTVNQDWTNFKKWVCGMEASESDSWSNVEWIPAARRGSGSNYYGMKMYQKVKEYQLKNGLIKYSDIWMRHPTLQWGDEMLQVRKGMTLVRRYSGNRVVGNFFGWTKQHWNRTHMRVPVDFIETIPGKTEIEFDEMRVISSSYEPSHYLTPLKGQIRIAIHSDEALENEEQCSLMARMIDFWANIHNNSYNLEVRADTRYDIGHVADLFEDKTKTFTKVLILGMSNNMDLESGQWTMSLDIVDLEPTEVATQ